MGAGRVLCDDVLRRRMRTCVLSVSSTVGRSVGRSVNRSVDPGTTSRHFGAETKMTTKNLTKTAELAVLDSTVSLKSCVLYVQQCY